jgi:hypothetical protein
MMGMLASVTPAAIIDRSTLYSPTKQHGDQRDRVRQLRDHHVPEALPAVRPKAGPTVAQTEATITAYRAKVGSPSQPLVHDLQHFGQPCDTLIDVGGNDG